MTKDMVFAQGEKPAWIKEAVGLFGQLQDVELIGQNQEFLQEIAQLRHRLEDKRFRVAVVGEFSAGKSTFLNSLLGLDLLKHGARETTATITEIQNVAQDGDGFSVYYTDGTCQENLALEELEQYTTTSSTQLEVARQVEKVVIFRHLFQADYPVSFLDTPGLNGVADNHRELTIAEVKQSHACIYLLQVRGLGKSDVVFLRQLCDYQKNFIFVQNFIDELKSLEGETTESKLAQQKKILQDQVFFDKADISYEMVGVSARNGLLARCPTITMVDGMELTQERRDCLWADSRFQEVMDAIETLAHRNQRESLAQKATIQSAIGWLENLELLFGGKQLELQSKWDNSLEGRTQAGQMALREKIVENQGTTLKKLENFVKANLIDGEKLVKTRSQEGLARALENLHNQVYKISTVDELEQFIQVGALSASLARAIDGIENDNTQLLQTIFAQLYRNSILRIEQYTSVATQGEDVADMEGFVLPQRTVNQGFQAQASQVSKLRDQLAELQESTQQLARQKEQDEQEIDKAAAEKRQLNGKVQQAERTKQQAIVRMGTKPEPEEKYRDEIYYEDRLFFNDWLGPKRRTRTVWYQDNTKGNAWLKRKQDIEMRCSKEVQSIQSTERMLNLKMQQLREKQKMDEHIRSLQITKASGVQRQLEAKLQEIKQKKELLQREYLRQMQGHTMEQVTQYLQGDGGAQETILDNLSAMVQANEPVIWNKVKSFYDQALTTRLAILDEKIKGGNTSQVLHQMIQSLEKIEAIRKKMEECLCHSL